MFMNTAWWAPVRPSRQLYRAMLYMSDKQHIFKRKTKAEIDGDLCTILN